MFFTRRHTMFDESEGEGPTTDPLTSINTLPTLLPGQMGVPQRAPLVIRGSGKAHALTGQISGRQRLLATVAAVGLSLLITLGAFVIAVPVDNQGHTALLALLGEHGIDFVPGKNGNMINIPAEMAAKAARVDGYDPMAHVEQPPTILADGSTIDRFYSGQCTYWANIRYHELTGFWVPWLGDAYEWYAQAITYHWHTSDRPNPNGPSIIVLGPYAQGANNMLGHVAVVEKDNGDGTVRTSNMHWPVLGTVSYVTFRYPQAGTHFIWLFR